MSEQLIKRGIRLLGICAVLAACCDCAWSIPDARWGRLANSGYTQQRIKTTLFFAGQARDGSSPYGCAPSPNLTLYTVHPSDPRHLNWYVSAANREYALDQMVSTGINAINMSSWGEAFLPCSTAWATYAPMQTAPTAHDELFAAVVSKSLLIIPFIESRADWAFRDEFPTWTDGSTAPGTISQIVELVNRYLRNSNHPEWRERWARVYDRTGQERYAVAIIQASSNRLASNDHAGYAAGFDALAEAVYSHTGVRVGFLIDALPPGTYAPGVFRPSPEATGPYLADRSSILGIQCFIPEVWLGLSNDSTLIAWKRDFSSRWTQSGIPFLMDVSPGYDAHLVFPGSVGYGLNSAWRSAVASMVMDYGGGGMIYNAWNGYTEALVAVPTTESGDVCLNWLTTLNNVAAIGTVSGAKAAPDYSSVAITGTVSAVLMGNDGAGELCPVGFGVQNSDRDAGIRVKSSTSVTPGQIVLVRGTTLTEEGERVIEASSASALGLGQPPRPLHAVNKATAGGPFGAQPAVYDDAVSLPNRYGSGANNVGLLMRVCGRVTKVTNSGDYSGFFYVDDGSALRDGSGYTGIKCRPPSNPADPSSLPSQGDFVTATGVVGVRQINGLNTRYLWTTNWQRVHP